MNISPKTIGHNRRFGLSLVEVLVALSMTLIVLVAMMQAFKFASGEMAKGRASVELTNQLRTVEDLLRSDLRSLTVDVKPHYNLSAPPKGYFEIVDGPAVDINSIANLFGVAATTDNINRSILNLAMGDHDDIISGTIRTSSVPFRGRNGNVVEESSLAEVIWFTVPNDRDGDFFVDVTERVNLYRRLMLVKPSLGKLLPPGAGTFPNLAAANAALTNFLEFNDISASVQPGPPGGGGNATFIIVANSLESLTVRGNRFFAATQGQVGSGVYREALLARRSTDQQDLIMTDIAAFDVRVFDPAEPVFQTALAGGEPLMTGDTLAMDTIGNVSSGAGFVTDEGATALNVGGAFVDLGKGANNGPTGGPLGRKPFGFGFTAAQYNVSTRQNFTDVYYDTGTPSYESNNVDDDGDGLIDEGRDGIDNVTGLVAGRIDELPTAVDTNNNGVFEFAEVDLGESEVPPPYNVAIRGIKVVVRGIEPLTKQVSQVSVTESLVAE